WICTRIEREIDGHNEKTGKVPSVSKHLRTFPMRATIQNFLTLKALNVIPAIYWMLAAIYVAFVLTTLWSIFSAGVKSSFGRGFWTLVILVLPIVGMFAYALRCLVLTDIRSLRQFGISKAKPASR